MKKVVVPGIFLAALSTPVFMEEAFAASVSKIVNIEANSSLNVRKGPSTSTAVITTLKKGKEVTVTSESNGWSKITVDGKSGYVSSTYLASKTKTSIKYVNVNSGSNLNVRKTPSASAEILLKIKNNTKVEVSSESKGWSKITVNGKVGYVSSEYLDSESNSNNSSTNTSEDSKSTTEETTKKYVNVDSGSSLNMRNKASASGSVIVKLAKGVEVTAYSESNGWTKVKVYGKEGYVSSKYLSSSKTNESNNSTISGSDSNTTSITKYVNVNDGSTLNLRSNASTKGNVLAQLKRGTKVSVASISGGWAKVTVNGKIGYLSDSYLSASNPTSSTQTPVADETVKETVSKYVNVEKNSSLNVRDKASNSGKVIKKLSRNTKVTVISESKGWAEISVDKITGYVSSSYLSDKEIDQENAENNNSETTPEKETTVLKYVEVSKGSSLNMRDKPSTSGSIVAKLTSGTEVTVYSEENGWAKVMVNGKEGYISSQYLKTSVIDETEETESETAPSTPEEEETVLKYVNVSEGSSLNMRDKASTSGSVVTKLVSGTVVTVYSEENGWAKVTANGKEGYVSSQYLTDKASNTPTANNGTSTIIYANYDITLEEMTTIQLTVNPQTDTSYDTYIREDALILKSSDPKVGTVLGNGWRVRGGAGTEFWVIGSVTSGQTLQIESKVKGSDGYYWYQVDYTKSWVNASAEDTTYYLNPDNFINNSVSSLQFLKLSEKANINDTEVNQKILAGKGILAGKASSFVTAASAYGINEIYLISHALLETGNGTSTLANGVTVNGKTVYNMYGIGAYDGSAVESGAQYAYNAGWFTPEAAIIGGAKFIAQGYINAGQDTLYKMRWNPNSASNDGVATHQYASDIGWATKQVNQIYNLYSLLSSYSAILEVPVYK